MMSVKNRSNFNSCVVLTRDEYVGLIQETVNHTIRELDLRVLGDENRKRACQQFSAMTALYFRKMCSLIGNGDQLIASDDQGVTCRLIKRRLAISKRALSHYMDEFYKVYKSACFYQMEALSGCPLLEYQTFLSYLQDLNYYIETQNHLEFMNRFLDGLQRWISGLWPYEVKFIAEYFIFQLNRKS